MHTRNAAPVQTGVYGIGRSLAASCSAGITQPVSWLYVAVPASENAVAEAATPPATAAAATARSSHRRSRPGTGRGRRAPGPRVPG